MPGTAEILISRYEIQANHRQALEAAVVNGNLRQALLGQIFAFVLFLVLIGTGGVLVYTGHYLGGVGTIGVAVASGIAVFITGKHEKMKDLENKRLTMPGPQ